MRRLLLLASLLLWVPSAYAQSVRYQSQVIGSRGLPLANQNVAVCTQPANTSTQPCSPLATLATSTSTTSGGTNPLTTDINGNFFFYAASGTYTIQIYGPQISTPFVQPDTNVGATGPASFTTITVSGPATFTGAVNSNNLAAGNVANKYATASAYRYVDGVGSDSNDGLSPGTAFATPQKCLTVVTGLGGGTCDARTLYTLSYSTEIDVGNHASQPPTTLLVPPYGTWTCTATSGNCLKVFNLSSVHGESAGQGIQFAITAGPTATVTDVCGTDGTVVGGGYVGISGIDCTAQSGTTVSGAVWNIQDLVDVSKITDVVAVTSASNSKALWAHGLCCGTHLDRVKGIANAATGSVPCTIGSLTDNNSGADIGPISCTNSGSGKSAIALVQSSGGNTGSKIHDVYAEMNVAGDTTSPVIAVTNSSGNVDVIDTVHFGSDAAGGASTRCIVDIALNSSVIIRNIQESNATCAINDHNTGRGIINPGANTVITDYSTENPCCGLSGYLSKPSIFGLTNNTGLQLFNTTTTCTTGASVGATCTTANITLPVAEADTSYRVACTGKGLTNVPVVIATTNASATQFTITIAALTAAAASFTSYDCVAGHN